MEDSDGNVRRNTEGAVVRYHFTRLPGVGAVTAKAWYEAGAR